MLFCLVAASAFAVASRQHDRQLWNWTRANFEKNDKSGFVQYQIRHSDERNAIYEQQFNTGAHRQFGKYKVGGIYTYGYFEALNQQRENRYAIEVEGDITAFGPHVYYSRVRQEFRDFIGDSGLSYRFRWLNGFKILKPIAFDYFLDFSSEFNIYLNSTDFVDSGFSSHRFSAALRPLSEKNPFSWNYIYDFNHTEDRDLHRHIFALGIVF